MSFYPIYTIGYTVLKGLIKKCVPDNIQTIVRYDQVTYDRLNISKEHTLFQGAFTKYILSVWKYWSFHYRKNDNVNTLYLVFLIQIKDSTSISTFIKRQK